MCGLASKLCTLLERAKCIDRGAIMIGAKEVVVWANSGFLNSFQHFLEGCPILSKLVHGGKDVLPIDGFPTPMVDRCCEMC